MNERDVNAEGCGCIVGMILIAIMFTIAILLEGCSPKIVERIVTRDSIVVEIRERIVHDTATFTIPVEVEKIATHDTVSRLENTYAISEATVSGGYLIHSLSTKPQQIAVPIDIPVMDTTTTHTSATDHEYQTTVEVEKPLTWWQSARIGAFWWLIGALAAALLWIFRKPILRMLRI